MDNNVAVRADELLDEDLKNILGKRYEDMSDKFTPEAQERRRNNRAIFTIKISVFMMVLMFSMCWANSVGLMSDNAYGLGLTLSALVVGYNLGVCVSHMKGWRD